MFVILILLYLVISNSWLFITLLHYFRIYLFVITLILRIQDIAIEDFKHYDSSIWTTMWIETVWIPMMFIASVDILFYYFLVVKVMWVKIMEGIYTQTAFFESNKSCLYKLEDKISEKKMGIAKAPKYCLVLQYICVCRHSYIITMGSKVVQVCKIIYFQLRTNNPSI